MTDRRYNEEEVAAIFRAAAEGSQAPAPQRSRDDGLTLTDLQGIGREVGIAPEAVAQAAHALDIRGQNTSPTLLGLPIGVRRTIMLNRWLTDAEWDLLVVQLREAFDARGAVRSHGSLREWRNGNLYALLEPTPSGHRLRLGTVKGDARASIVGGLTMLGATAAVIITSLVGHQMGNAFPGIAFLGVAGLGLITAGALRLPRWARLRAEQMEAIAARLTDAAPTAPPSAAR